MPESMCKMKKQVKAWEKVVVVKHLLSVVGNCLNSIQQINIQFY